MTSCWRSAPHIAVVSAAFACGMQPALQVQAAGIASAGNLNGSLHLTANEFATLTPKLPITTIVKFMQIRTQTLDPPAARVNL